MMTQFVFHPRSCPRGKHQAPYWLLRSRSRETSDSEDLRRQPRAQDSEVLRLRLLFFAVAFAIAIIECCGVAVADEPPDSVDRDYSAELLRIPPTEPDAALKTFKLAPGFRIELAAAEPLVVDPVAMAFDEFGRLFVVEMRGYSEDDKLNLGRVRLLTDTDGDGRFDKSTVYVDGLSWPTAMACWDGGIFVGAAPDIFYCKDTDGDGVADEKRVVYTGFGRSNVQGLLNTFKWGPDNRIHGATSSSGASVRRPDKPDAPPLELRGRDFAFDPRTLDIEATSGGGQHGLSFNDLGEKFVCSNSNHIQFVAFEDRYAARNPYLKPPAVRWSIAADGPQADVFRASPVEPWRIVRTRLRVKGIVPGPVEGGGTAAGYFTGSTGITIYHGDAWPQQYRGWAFIADVGSNLIHRKRLERKGIGYVAYRVDEKSEFLTSTDIWFRPVQMCNGPDGCLYVVDMYREVIEHPHSLPPPIKKHLDLTSGRDRGRIYRIVPDGFQQSKVPRLGEKNTSELVGTLLNSTNGWALDTAARLIVERDDRRAIHELQLAAGTPHFSTRAATLLSKVGGLDPAIVLTLLDGPPEARRCGVQLAEEVVDRSAAVREKLVAMADDDDRLVRYQLAFSLGQFTGEGRNKALAAIVRRDADDEYVRFAVQSSLATGAGSVLAELAADEDFRNSSGGRTFLRGLVVQIARQQRPDDVAALLVTLQRIAEEDAGLLQELIAAAALKSDSPLARQIETATAGRSAKAVAELLAAAAATAADRERTVGDRAEAVYLLRLGALEDHQELLTSLLDTAEPTDVQLAALSTLASFDRPAVAALILKHWPTFTPRVRTRAQDVLFSRESWLVELLDAAIQQPLVARDLDVARLKILKARNNTGIRDRAAKLYAAAVSDAASHRSVLDSYEQALKLPADAAHGKEVFKKICAACHRVEGVGFEIAPNLATMRNRTPDNILLNVLDPSREVNPQYVLYEIVTKDGRSLTGMIADETATSVTLKRANNETDTVLRIDIDTMQSSGLSLMPAGLEKQIDRQAMADLIAYLQSLE